MVTDKTLTDQINRDSAAMQRKCRRVIVAHGLKEEFTMNEGRQLSCIGRQWLF